MMDSIGAHVSRVIISGKRAEAGSGSTLESEAESRATDAGVGTGAAENNIANAVLSEPFLFQDVRPEAVAAPVVPYSLLWITEPCEEGVIICASKAPTPSSSVSWVS